MRRFSLPSRLSPALDLPLLPVMTAVFLGVLLSTLVAYLYTRHTVQDLAEQRMTQDLLHLDRALDARTKSMFYHLELLGGEEMIRLTLEDSYLGQSARIAAQPKLATRVKSGVFDRLMVFDASGQMIVASDSKLLGALHLQDRGYFLRALRGTNARETLISRITGRPTLAASIPILAHDGQVLGVLVAVKDTDHFAREVLDGVHIGETGGAYMLSEQGQVIASPSWAAKDQFNPGESAAKVLEAGKASGILRYSRQNTERLCAARLNQETGWCLVVEADSAEVLRPATRLATLTGVISFGTLALVALALGALRRTMSQLRQSEARSRTLTELSPVGILTCDASGLLRYANPQARLVLGQEESGPLPVSLGLETQAGEALPPEADPIMQALGRGEPVMGALAWHTLPDGNRRVLSINAAPLLTEGAVATLEDVTERRRNVEALINEKRFTETLLDGLPGIFYLYDSNLCLRRWNTNHETATGYSAEEMRGRRIEDWHTSEDNRQFVLKSGQMVLHEVRSAQIESTLLHKDGREVPYLLTGVRLDTPEGPMLMGVGFDISERKQAEERLRQSEEKFSLLFRLSPDIISLVDQETGLIVDVNDAFCRNTGLSREEVLGRSFEVLALLSDSAASRGLQERLLRDGHVENQELEVNRRDGTVITVSLSLQMLEIGGKAYSIGIARDITAIKKMQEMMVQTEKMLSIGGIAAGIAHEINNPLGIVLQAAQTLAQRTNPQFKKNMDVAQEIGLDMGLLAQYFHARKLDTFIEDIQAAAMRASAIIRHMLDFSRKSESRRSPCRIEAIIDKAVALAGNDYDLKKSYDFKKIEIVRNYAPGLPEVDCTETEIEQVLLNLLRNTAQAMTSADPPVLAPRIDIRVNRLPGQVRIELADNGPGMTEDVRRRIFEPFYTTKAPGVGTGLGLSVSYFIITKGHNGRLAVDSRPGEGAKFTIELPTGENREAHA